MTDDLPEGWASHHAYDRAQGEASVAEGVLRRRSRAIDVAVMASPFCAAVVAIILGLGIAHELGTRAAQRADRQTAAVNRRADAVVANDVALTKALSDSNEVNRALADQNRQLAAFADLARTLLTSANDAQRLQAVAGLRALTPTPTTAPARQTPTTRPQAAPAAPRAGPPPTTAPARPRATTPTTAPRSCPTLPIVGCVP